MNFLGKLQRNPWVNATVKNLRIHRIADALLSRFPRRRATPFGLSYEVNSIPSLVVASEMFSSDVYSGPIERVQPKSFVDLGANVGLFPVLVADVMKSRDVCGLCVEPNPNLLKLAAAHLITNGLTNVHLLEAVVSGGGEMADIPFFLSPSHIASSLSGKFNPLVPTGGEVKEIRVKAIDILSEWERHFPAKRVNLLKVDIEGSEIEFLKGNASFLEKVDAILIEWHNWVANLGEVEAILQQCGFRLERICESDANVGTAFFLRSA